MKWLGSSTYNEIAFSQINESNFFGVVFDDVLDFFLGKVIRLGRLYSGVLSVVEPGLKIRSIFAHSDNR